MQVGRAEKTKCIWRTAVLLLVLALLALGCGSHPIIDPNHGAGLPKGLPEISAEREAAEAAMAEALQQYLSAREATEKISQLYAQGAQAEAAELQSARNAWQEAAQLTERAEEAARILGATPAQGEQALSLRLFGNVAHASMPLDREEEKALQQEGEAFVKAYAEWPAREKLLLLGGQIREDAAKGSSLFEALLEQAEPPASLQQELAAFKEGCQLKVFSRKEARWAVEGRGGGEAFAHLWNETGTLVEIGETDSQVLLGRNPEVVFLVGKAKILPKNET